jgi:hypothetical protein
VRGRGRSHCALSCCPDRPRSCLPAKIACALEAVKQENDDGKLELPSSMNTTLGAAARALEYTAASAFSLSPTDPCTCRRTHEKGYCILHIALGGLKEMLQFRVLIWRRKPRAGLQRQLRARATSCRIRAGRGARCRRWRACQARAFRQRV